MHLIRFVYIHANCCHQANMAVESTKPTVSWYNTAYFKHKKTNRKQGMSIFDRTFHPDEANQAFTTGKLLETGVYKYDPKDHHGPTLYYAAAAMQKAAGNNTTASLDGTLLRCTPLLFAIIALGFCFLGLCKLFREHSSRKLQATAFTLLLATSPIFAFFATDFIQEMLLAAFTAMMFWTAVGYTVKNECTGKVKPGTWTLFFGIAAGLAFATKETAVLTFAASAATAILLLAGSLIPCNRRHFSLPDTDTAKVSSHMFLAVAGFALTSILFYSSFASNWQGLYNAFIAAPMSYIHRAAGDAVSEGAAYHVHPWWRYLKWLFGTNPCFAVFTACGIGLGIFSCLNRRKDGEILSTARMAFVASLVYSTMLIALYSTIPYKTPWCALQLHIPLLLCGFLGLMLFATVNAIRRMTAILIMVLMFGENCCLLAQMWRDPDSKNIPYNYASASPQVKDMAQLIESRVSDGKSSGKCFIAVALPSEDTWPLPFYLRNINSNVGYWTQFEELEMLAALNRKPDVVVVPAEQGHLVQPLFPHLKNTKRFEMRHRVRIRVFW